jgi:hypothetical protein
VNLPRSLLLAAGVAVAIFVVAALILAIFGI